MKTRSSAVSILLLALGACGEAPPPAVSVGPVSFSEDQLLGLSLERRQDLGRLAAFGLAVADSTAAELGRPVTERWVDDRLLEILAAEKTVADAGVAPEALEAH